MDFLHLCSPCTHFDPSWTCSNQARLSSALLCAGGRAASSEAVAGVRLVGPAVRALAAALSLSLSLQILLPLGSLTLLRAQLRMLELSSAVLCAGDRAASSEAVAGDGYDRPAGALALPGRKSLQCSQLPCTPDSVQPGRCVPKCSLVHADEQSLQWHAQPCTSPRI